MARNNMRGFSLIELLVGVALLSAIGIAVTTLLLHHTRVNRSQQLLAEVQANARTSMERVVNRLRSAGWDPMNAGVGIVATDPDPADAVSEIEIFADLDEDGAISSDGEQVRIRHAADRIEWRINGDTSAPFVTIATNISNDADGDGTVEPMFQPDDPTNPRTITVQITARSASRDPLTRDHIRYTLVNEVALRKRL
jgi:prepilin-type N-terminal cleavage/methylation domain-containing protein